ncbi:MAG: zinc ribbon domain-containing protein [Clostridia bacterium]|nr:zinc ribbon domain-containing protein [Clostridia bacterium]
MRDDTKSEKYLLLEAFGMGPNVMRKMKVCKNCGQIAGAWSIFCPACRKLLSGGTLFDTYRRMHVNCPHCKTVLASDTRYCPHCGRKVARKASTLSL